MKESKKKKLTQARLKELMNYDPATGVFIRKIYPGGPIECKAGRVAGAMAHGYLQIGIDRKKYYCHRLAWLYAYGHFPENEIDHINRNKIDNRIDNLREVSRQCNIRNYGLSKNNKSGVKGVHWFALRSRWQATIKVGYKCICLGTYRSKDNAACARLAAEQCLGWKGCDSNSTAFMYVKNLQKKNIRR